MPSSSVAVHLVRGLLGLGFLAVALNYAPFWGWWALIPAAVAFYCFRGCPLCWTMGLIVTAVDGRKAAACGDGSCGIDETPKWDRLGKSDGS